MKYRFCAMRQSRLRSKTQDLYLQSTCSSVLSGFEADSEMSSEETPSRPSSIAINRICSTQRRPNLQDILSGTSAPPFTLSAFMAYLSQNHCLETLEFTLDSQRYATHYKSLAERNPLTPISPTNPDYEYVRMLWQKLMDAYIAPNGPREVNLPSDVRDRLLKLPCVDTPPNAVELEPAVKIIYELMDESVLVPFVYSVAPVQMADGRTSPQLSHSHLTAALRPASTRISTLFSSSSTSSDDSTDSASPPGSSLDPITPPDTPSLPSPSSSPHTLRMEGRSWKAMSAKLWKKSSRGSSTSSYRHPSAEITDDSLGRSL